MNANAPIGIFDSGVGGLTVYRAVAGGLPGEALVYVGDTARVPYGNKSAETVRRYSLEIAAWLTTQHAVKAIVVACNTSSALALTALRERCAVPVIGVIEPGVEAALRATRSGRIGVIGTAATIGSGAYQRAIVARAPTAQVHAKACPLFVPLVEEGWVDGAIPEAIVREYLQPLQAAGIDTLVLGCTHYPVLAPVIARVLGTEIALVDSGAATATALQQVLTERGLQVPSRSQPARHLYVTDGARHVATIAARLLDAHTAPVELITL